jgi:hypothetical protein
VKVAGDLSGEQHKLVVSIRRNKQLRFGHWIGHCDGFGANFVCAHLPKIRIAHIE